METYLEALERLGRLLDAGVLTKEEFESEKAHLLQGRARESEQRKPPSKLSKRQYVVISIALVTTIVGALSYFAFSEIAGVKAESAETKAANSVQNAAERPTEDLSVTFADAANCDAGPSLSNFLSRLRDAGKADQDSELRLVTITGQASPVQVRSSSRNFGQQQVFLTSLPIVTTWRGLRVSEVRTADWDRGTGFQLRFESSPENVVRTLRDEGFKIVSYDKPVTQQGTFVAVERTPGGAVLTCMKSNEAGRPDDGDEVTDAGGPEE